MLDIVLLEVKGQENLVLNPKYKPYQAQKEDILVKILTVQTVMFLLLLVVE